MRKKWIFGLIALLAIYFSGALSARHNIFPWPQLSALRDLSRPSEVKETRYTIEDNKRLIADETKTAVSCPKQTDRTAVFLIIGQSNAANHGGQRYRSDYGERIVNFFGDRCYIAASPLLGSTDTKGEYWTRLGNLLIASGKVDNVVIAPLAFDGSEVARWAQGGDINKMLVETAKQLGRANYRVTEALWDQGEIDYVLGTSSEAYSERFLSMVDTLRKQGIAAPVYITIASKCLEHSNGGFKTHVADNAIVRAQMALSKNEKGLKEGVNTDTLLTELDRYDDCHMAGSGEEKVAQAWANLLLRDRQQANPQ